MWVVFKRSGATLVGAAGVVSIACWVYLLIHLKAFEWGPILGFFGWAGIAFVAFLTLGVIVLTVESVKRALSWPKWGSKPSPRLATLLVVWLIAVLWLAEWVYMEVPLTVRVATWVRGAEGERTAERRALMLALDKARQDGSIDALVSPTYPADQERLAIMLARIAANRPAVFAHTPIGVVIRKYADRYGVSPVLLLYWTYIDSFYGEAHAGPMPMFTGGLTPETFRDLVQAHLPPWLIESPIRIALIEGPWFDYVINEQLANKLRYALQKATYDISISPYPNSVFSDTFLVLHEYKAEFPELFADGNAADPLASAFLAIENDGLLSPYDQPYTQARRDREYYDRHRDDLMSFARAAVYRLTGDFDFATKIQALVARYYSDQYAKRIGAARWAELSERQQTTLLAMLRDVYTPNIGTLSYNVYMLPEFNCTPIDFLADQVNRDFDSVRRTDKTWKPQHGERLWGATGLLLRVLDEVWDVMTGTPLPGVVSPDTVSDALKVVARNQ